MFPIAIWNPNNKAIINTAETGLPGFDNAKSEGHDKTPQADGKLSNSVYRPSTFILF